MSIIRVNEAVKVFRQYRRFPGVIGSLRSLITREYTEHTAVNGISFEIREGESVGYLGTNGAGKSTMIKMMTGILVPTSGVLQVMGNTPHTSRKKNAQEIGVVFGQRSQLWWDLPVEDSFDLHKHIYKIENKRFHDNLNYCVEILGIQEFIHKPVRQLSLGQRMRVEIAMALLHEPRILFLDEPTIGLDLFAKDQIRNFLKKVNSERKVTIILTTHDLKDIEEICPRMIIVNKGDLVYDGKVSDLRTQIGNERKITIDFRHDIGNIDFPGTILVKDQGLRKTFVLERGKESAFEWVSKIAEKYPVEDVSLEDSDIESVIRTLYENLETTSINE
ncbi:ABC transporter ATP-binding protein [Paenibacillus periandrae]|uniref:ABC transporter ATP-binding protein n=1 Tax=Paenibacillus periandrae TaxID=1761741 RepID=UPI001F096836|nr:ATP-binding cassette domain-containing protein [Paenibacillus periandrae]